MSNIGDYSFCDSMLHWSLQILAQLTILHKHNFVHCDIKGQNILITEQGDAFICDFGLVQKQSQVFDDVRNHELYTSTHRPPELHGPFSKRCKVQCSADLWALGATLYECFFGPLPADEDPILWNKLIFPMDLEQRKTKFECLFTKAYGRIKHQSLFIDLLSGLLNYCSESRQSSAHWLTFLQTNLSGISKTLDSSLDNNIIVWLTQLEESPLVPKIISKVTNHVTTQGEFQICWFLKLGLLNQQYKHRSDHLETLHIVIANIAVLLGCSQLDFEQEAQQLFGLFMSLNCWSDLDQCILMRAVLACCLSCYLYKSSFDLKSSECARLANLNEPKIFEVYIEQAIHIAIKYPLWSSSWILR